MDNRLEELTICPMSESDLDGVLAIESDSFPRPWTRAHFLAELEATHSFPLVALGADNRVIGYICPMLVLDEGHILDVAVHRCYRGRGIGRLLVERVLLDCGERGAAFVSLEVRLSNASAIALYWRLGFTETGRRKAYYENGEDALLMEYSY
ncbi:ribosomal protein S18-alanine N-acetyltransferase [Geotalea sp. SG265]|uniref:ribosomal protein S18-alanine N-acetyltransferase n=1 Tax=Geotalea sp. SG265 TaxID=2922867 RepID=UPI001FAF2EC7|nr:ribosomal protein S18-alanine N-acetyltransferase [Geotalea sp. SG265]